MVKSSISTKEEKMAQIRNALSV
ncbi:MAG: hypothetical protein RLZZ289_65, partial [Bacteroidota bacterium]